MYAGEFELKVGVETCTIHVDKSERHWLLKAELQNHLWENSGNSTITQPVKEGDVWSFGKTGKLKPEPRV